METCAVIVVVSLERAERTLLAGDMPCPRCQGVLRPFGTGRTRTVRGVGADTVTVTPRRARCRDCSATQILLPTELMVRRADSTEAIGNALAAKSRGDGYRSIAARFGRPESTVRRWLRAVREPHAQWLYRRGVDQAVLVDRELLVRPVPQQTTLGHALNLLAGAAVRFRECFGRSDPVWSLIGFFAHGRLLAAPRPRRT
jgi:transposase-like protein